MSSSQSSSSRRVGLVFDDSFLSYNNGPDLIGDEHPYPFATAVPHPSGPELVGRAKHLMDLHGISASMVRIEPYEASDDALLVFHTPDYLDRVKQLDRVGGSAGNIGDRAQMPVGGLAIARLSAGGVMAAVDAVMEGRVNTAYALVRPPGHHAVADHGMGFCVFSNVAIAAHHARSHHGIQRIAIVDWDVHHGNGTQEAFHADPGVLFVSLHQENHYPPESGAAEDIGEGAGEGYTVNIPLPAGSGHAAYMAAFDRIVEPAVRAFAPELIIVSAGQDASVSDPLARMCLTTWSYREMTSRMLALADDLCDGRMVVAQEGGYAPAYAPYCSAAIAETLVGSAAGVTPIPENYGSRARALPPTTRVGLDAGEAIETVVSLHGLRLGR